LSLSQSEKNPTRDGISFALASTWEKHGKALPGNCKRYKQLMKGKESMRRIIVVWCILLAGVLTSKGSINVQAWYHLGEPGTLPGGLPLDSSGNGNNMNDGFSEFESVHISPNTPGGPLGTSGVVSRIAVEDGQTIESHSISAGLDYPGVGPEHARLRETGRAEYRPITGEGRRNSRRPSGIAVHTLLNRTGYFRVERLLDRIGKFIARNVLPNGNDRGFLSRYRKIKSLLKDKK
jgi:hypothetical protein